jgi:hypothetical protein
MLFKYGSAVHSVTPALQLHLVLRDLGGGNGFGLDPCVK